MNLFTFSFSPLHVVLAVLFFIWGLLCLIKPELTWKIKTMFSVNSGEPSEFFIKSARVSGVVWLIAGVIFLLL